MSIGRWTAGQTIDFLLAARRDTAAAKRFFRKALAQPHTVDPRTLTVDKNSAYPRAVAEMKRDGERCAVLVSGNASIRIILSSRIIGASSVWSDLGSASAGSQPPEEHWQVSKRWR